MPQRSADPLSEGTEDVAFRLRHMLSMIRSIVRRSALDAEDVPTYAARLDGRIAVIARIQIEAANDPQHHVGLNALIVAELQTHAIREDEAVSVQLPDLRLNARAAGALALAVHELVENSLETGALSVARHAIEIAAGVEDETFRFDWTEALPDGEASPSFETFGRDYLEDGISYDLDATTRLTIERGALRFSLASPVARILAPAPPIASIVALPATVSGKPG